MNNFHEIDDSINAVREEIAQENTLMAEAPTALGSVQRVVKLFRGLRPFLAAAGQLPFIPPTWREFIDTFVTALDGLAAIDLTTSFKAGRDL